MYILEKLNFKISWGTMPPDPPSVLAPSALVPSFAGPTMGKAWFTLGTEAETETGAEATVSVSVQVRTDTTEAETEASLSCLVL